VRNWELNMQFHEHCHNQQNNAHSEYHTNSILLWQFLHQSTRIFNTNKRILFSLKTGRYWRRHYFFSTFLFFYSIYFLNHGKRDNQEFVKELYMSLTVVNTLLQIFYCSHWVYTSKAFGRFVRFVTFKLLSSVPLSISSRPGQPEIFFYETWLRLTLSSKAIFNNLIAWVFAGEATAACGWYTRPRIKTRIPLVNARCGGVDVNVIGWQSRRICHDEGEEAGYDSEGSEFHGSGFVLLFWSRKNQHWFWSWPGRGVLFTC
jgi:hypothetical protein